MLRWYWQGQVRCRGASLDPNRPALPKAIPCACDRLVVFLSYSATAVSWYIAMYHSPSFSTQTLEE
jgi:hypothetical protein